MKRNKIIDAQYEHNMNAFLKARDANRLSEKKKSKQLDVLIQQQQQYEFENEQHKKEYEEQLDVVRQMQDWFKDENEKKTNQTRGRTRPTEIGKRKTITQTGTRTRILQKRKQKPKKRTSRSTTKAFRSTESLSA